MPDLSSSYDWYGAAASQLELFREVAPLPAFLQHVPAAQYLFLTAERRLVYTTILHFLYLRRHAHEIEKYHNDIYDAVQPTIEEATQSDYSLTAFRADMDQLVAWGNIERRLEPYRLQRISDRRLQKFLYRLSEPTRCLLEGLVTLRPPREFDRVLLDQDHLYDIEERLERAEKIHAEGAHDDETLRRLARCFVEIDTKCRLIATEITEFGARIATFNTAPFQLETLPEIIDWLERYVDQYLQRVAKVGPELYHRLSAWTRGDQRTLLAAAHQAAREHVLANPLAAPWADQLRSIDAMLADVVPFFAPEGLFNALCARINEQVRALVRRIRQHLDDIRRRNIRMQALRKRTREVLLAPESALPTLRAWLNELIGSGHMHNDAGGGTPSHRAAPPRPTYWRRRVARPPFQGAVLARKQGSLELTRELERARLMRLSRFVAEGLLLGAPRAYVAELRLASPADVRNFMDAVKAHALGRRRDREQLGYRIIALREAELTRQGLPAAAEFAGDAWRFSAPNYRVEVRGT